MGFRQKDLNLNAACCMNLNASYLMNLGKLLNLSFLTSK